MWLIELGFYLNSANLICRSTDISKYFRQSLGIRDNESRLYVSDKSTQLDMGLGFPIFKRNQKVH